MTRMNGWLVNPSGHLLAKVGASRYYPYRILPRLSNRQSSPSARQQGLVCINGNFLKPIRVTSKSGFLLFRVVTVIRIKSFGLCPLESGDAATDEGHRKVGECGGGRRGDNTVEKPLACIQHSWEEAHGLNVTLT